MNSKELRTYCRQLETLAERLRAEVMNLRGEAIAPPAERSEIPVHEAEEGRVRTVLMNEEQLLDEVEAALDRIGQGTFGRCAHCGEPISRQRLEALPYSRHCVGCAESQEAVAT